MWSKLSHLTEDEEVKGEGEGPLMLMHLYLGRGARGNLPADASVSFRLVKLKLKLFSPLFFWSFFFFLLNAAQDREKLTALKAPSCIRSRRT